MDVKIDSLIPFDTLRTDLDHVFSIVEKNSKAVLLKDNKPVYVMLKCDIEVMNRGSMPDKQNKYTLQEAMKIVLSEVDNKTTHASEIADKIYERRLYLQKSGEKAQYNQIIAWCGYYSDMFEALPGDYIRLKGE